MEGQATSAKSGRAHPLLWAIVELREQIDRAIEEQRALLLGWEPESIVIEPAPPPLKPEPLHIEAEPGIEPAQKPPRPSFLSTPAPPVVEAADPPVVESTRPDDARQRLDALAAKLLDRRKKQVGADPPSRPGE